MSKEPIIPCTVCLGETTHYWQNSEHSPHMVCDACYIQLNQQMNAICDSNDEDHIRFVEMFAEWRSGHVTYNKVTPQSMLERFLVQIFVEEE